MLLDLTIWTQDFFYFALKCQSKMNTTFLQSLIKGPTYTQMYTFSLSSLLNTFLNAQSLDRSLTVALPSVSSQLGDTLVSCYMTRMHRNTAGSMLPVEAGSLQVHHSVYSTLPPVRSQICITFNCQLDLNLSLLYA